LLIESLSLSGRCGEDSKEAQAIWRASFGRTRVRQTPRISI
jgi:hypothetical protein